MRRTDHLITAALSCYHHRNHPYHVGPFPVLYTTPSDERTLASDNLIRSLLNPNLKDRLTRCHHNRSLVQKVDILIDTLVSACHGVEVLSERGTGAFVPFAILLPLFVTNRKAL
jgi:hypothetical protein